MNRLDPVLPVVQSAKIDFCNRWLQAWSVQDIPHLLTFYAQDVRYIDPAVPNGIDGQGELRSYLQSYFARTGRLRFQVDEFWETDRGFVCRWYATMDGEADRLRGLDLVELRDDQITLNELYVHKL